VFAFTEVRSTGPSASRVSLYATENYPMRKDTASATWCHARTSKQHQDTNSPRFVSHSRSTKAAINAVRLISERDSEMRLPLCGRTARHRFQGSRFLSIGVSHVFEFIGICYSSLLPTRIMPHRCALVVGPLNTEPSIDMLVGRDCANTPSTRV
jgi:hypothetical protein